jgi:hypothetical protein
MQIHELTQPQLDEGLADIAGKVGRGVAAVKGAGAKMAAPFKAAGQAYNKTQIDQKVKATTDKAYTAWTNYKAQLDKFYTDQGKKATPADYEKALMAFTQKNLLGGQYLPNLTNKDDIVNLVKKISAAPVPTGGAGAFGQMAQQLGKDPAVGTQAPTSTGGTTTITSTGMVNKAKAPVAPAPGVKAGKIPSTPVGNKSAKVSPAPKAGGPTPAEQAKFQQMIQQATKKPVQEAVNPAQEKQLFTQLVRAAALAQTAASTGSTQASQTTQSDQQTAQSLVSQVRDTEQQQAQITPQQLAKVGQVLMQTFQIDAGVDSTGDKAVDALLLAMGFRPQ